MSTDACRLSHHFPSIARSAKDRIAVGLEYSTDWTSTVVFGGPVHSCRGDMPLEVVSFAHYEYIEELHCFLSVIWLGLGLDIDEYGSRGGEPTSLPLNRRA